MQLTQRDIRVLEFINDFGFCQTKHIEQRFGLKAPRAYKVLKRLVKSQFLLQERLFHNEPRTLRASEKGASLTDLPPLGRILVAQCRHDLMVIAVFLKMIQRYPGLIWTTERRLRYTLCEAGIAHPKQGHVADGKVILPDGRHIAIEVELTLKNKTRLEKILKGYSAEFDISEVWYFCRDTVISTLQKLSTTLPLIKTFSLKEFLA